MRIAVDLDGTLCEDMPDWRDYHKAPPIEKWIMKIRKLAQEGHEIIIYTARPNVDREVTTRWLKDNNVPYTALVMDKLRADLYIDQDSKRMEEL